jgi:hypothetical protein
MEEDDTPGRERCTGGVYKGRGRTLGHKALDRLAAKGCGDPDCDHQHDSEPMTMSPGCHPGSPVTAEYTFADGFFVLVCATCGGVIACLELAAEGRVRDDNTGDLSE